MSDIDRDPAFVEAHARIQRATACCLSDSPTCPAEAALRSLHERLIEGIDGLPCSTEGEWRGVQGALLLLEREALPAPSTSGSR